jgi:hypothetical protein
VIKTEDLTNIQQDTSSWVRDPDTGRPIPPTQQPGYYPGYSTMSQRPYWDATTRALVEDRVYNIPPIRFFNEEEVLTITAVMDRVIPQDDRTPDRRIKVVNYLDERLYNNQTDGYRFEDMPDDREAYRLGIEAIDQTSREIHGVPFVDLDALKQDFLLKSIHDGKKLGAHEIWDKMSIKRFWHMLVQDAVHMYYAHPWAWDEIGYGGPAYPRAYMRLENGQPEPWEVEEERYEWAAPANSISDVWEPDTGHEGSTGGQGGTH